MHMEFVWFINVHYFEDSAVDRRGNQVPTGNIMTIVYKIGPNGDLTAIAAIKYGKRTEFPNEDPLIFKKLKE